MERDPNVIAKECEDMAGGMDQQAISSQSGTALAGHPNPAFFYGKVAALLREAAKFIRDASAPPTLSSPPPPPPPATETKPKPEKK